MTFSQSVFNQEPQVRVLLANTADTLDIDLRGQWSLRNTGRASMQLTENSRVRFINGGGQLYMYDARGSLLAKTPSFMLGSNSDTTGLFLDTPPAGNELQGSRGARRYYQGQLHLYLGSDQEMNIVLQLPLEDYIKEVLPDDLPPELPLAALQAQAIMIRSQAVFALSKPVQEGVFYHLRFEVDAPTPSVHIQATELIDQAVDETTGLILTINGALLDPQDTRSTVLIRDLYSARRGELHELFSKNTSLEEILSHYYPQAKVTTIYAP